jgi:hypothetical protein
MGRWPASTGRDDAGGGAQRREVPARQRIQEEFLAGLEEKARAAWDAAEAAMAPPAPGSGSVL